MNARPPMPQTLPPALQGFTAFNQWLNYRLTPQVNGKLKKEAIGREGYRVDPTDPARWMTYQDAAATGLPLAFSFSDSDPFFFLDIDNGLSDSGEWSSLAQSMCTRFAGCAIEVSSSGRGLHIFGVGNRERHSNRRDDLGVEFYTRGRFVALTGNMLTPDGSVFHSPPELAALVAEYFPPSQHQAATDWTDGPCDGWAGPTDDDELVRRACRHVSAAAAFAGKATFADLWAGNAEALSESYPSSTSAYDGSSADAALCAHLAWWTGKDCERMTRLLRASGLARDKHDREDYVQRTVLRACGLVTDVLRDKSEGDWPELVPFSVQSSKAENFPFDALGSILGNAARAIAEDVQAPDSLAAGSVLAAASLSVQALADVVLPHGDKTPLSLFVITGAASGDRKTAVDKNACYAVNEFRQHQAREYTRQMQSYEAFAANSDKDTKPPPPKTLTINNATVEGVATLLKNQSHVGIFTAEGGELLGGHSLSNERRSAGLAFYLKAWSAEELSALRVGSGLNSLLGRRMAMHVLVQPVLLHQLMGDTLANDQGLLARCLIAEPMTLAGTRLYRPANVQRRPEVVAYNERLKALLGIMPTVHPDGDGYELVPQELAISTLAAQHWVNFYDEVEAKQAPGKEFSGIRPFASKAAEQAARIAGVIAMVESNGVSQIEEAQMLGGIKIARFYLQEHLRLMGSALQVNSERLPRKMVDWILKAGGHVTNAHILQSCPSEIRKLKAQKINELLSELAKRGYVRESSSGWEANPLANC
ncbi:DUF3987 domain-containing protein [Comamonas sp. E6]|uniref:phage NrS-1 polymerase family protein n=1 Tax=Comamonas sp. E6 TaxID=364029 RepID=UPI000636A5E8|nr:DUF3987 domain-containing protein [Comamonas sp. E6]GAO71878.1 hypothetical protein CSE6_018_33150 [Comamonas sp. E6]